MSRLDELAKALEPFGWEVTEQFAAEYHQNVWVFNLANAVAALTAEAGRQYERAQKYLGERDEALAWHAALTAENARLARAYLETFDGGRETKP